MQPFLLDPNMSILLSTLDVGTNDLLSLFTLVDDGDGQLSPQEFVSGIGKLKGPAKAVDLFAVAKTLERLEAKLCAPAKAERGRE